MGCEAGELFSHLLCSNGQLLPSWPAEMVREHQPLLQRLAEPFQHLAIRSSAVNVSPTKPKSLLSGTQTRGRVSSAFTWGNKINVWFVKSYKWLLVCTLYYLRNWLSVEFFGWSVKLIKESTRITIDILGVVCLYSRSTYAQPKTDFFILVENKMVKIPFLFCILTVWFWFSVLFLTAPAESSP